MAKKLVGNDPDQVPTNGDLGDLAYKDGDNAIIGPISVSNNNVTVTGNGYLLAEGSIYSQSSFVGDVDAVTSSSGTLSIDVRNANTFQHVLTENTTISLIGTVGGYANTITLYVVQDASASGYTLSFPSGTRFAGGTAPTLTSTASALDVLLLNFFSGVLYVYVLGQDVK